MSQNDHHDVETRLRTFVHDPGPAVKPAVMAAFRRRHARPPIWARGIPLYAVVTLLAMAVGLTLVVERTRPAGPSSSSRAIAVADTALSWSHAVRDQM